jgi:hypothetical protein
LKVSVIFENILDGYALEVGEFLSYWRRSVTLSWEWADVRVIGKAFYPSMRDKVHLKL